MAVLLKLALLLIYLSVLFILARLLEAVVWFEQGQISHRLLDPMALSVLKLKALLEQRGVSYDNVVEKTELKQLVEASGTIISEELQDVAVATQTDIAVTNYTGEADFYEQVEDAKDSMWLVEIVSDTGVLLSDTSWQAIKKKVGKFGVRFGRLDCQINIRLCTRRQWFSSRLVLALPENYRSKANVALYTYPGPIRVNSLFDWMKLKVNEQIKPIVDLQTFENKWMNFESTLMPEVRVVFMSTMTSVPLFLSALSVKFPGRVKIGCINTRTEKGKQFVKKADLKSIPSYMIFTSEGTYPYGSGRGEVLSFRAMELFLKSFYPSLNDLFIVTLIFTNITSLFEISLANGTVVRRFVKLVFCVFKYNFILFLAWILLLTCFQLPILNQICLIGLKVVRLCASTLLFSFIRKDILYYSTSPTVPLGVIAFMLTVVAVVKLRYFSQNAGTDEENDWWNFSSLQTLDYEQWWELTRLRPFDQIFNPTVGILSAGGEALEVNQLFVSKEYIKRLPCWFFREEMNVCECEMKDQASSNTGVQCVSCTLGPSCDDRFGQSKDKHKGIESSLSDNNYKCHCFPNCKQHKKNETEGANENPNLTKEASNRDAFWEFTKCYAVQSLNMCDSKPDGFLETCQCVICLENYQHQVLLRGLPCGHVFHAKCVGAWLMRDNHFCPVCRWPSYKTKDGGIGNSLHSE